MDRQTELEIRELNEMLNTAMRRILELESRIRQLETITNPNTFKWQPHTEPYPVWQPHTPEYFVIKPDPDKYYVGTPPQLFPSMCSGTVLVADSEGGVHWEHTESLSSFMATNGPLWNPE